MRRMLEAKKQEVQGDLSRSMDYAQIAEKTAEERKRTREEKQRQARQQAIQVRVEPHSEERCSTHLATIDSFGLGVGSLIFGLCATANF